MSIPDFLLSESYVAEKNDMPIIREVIERMTIEKPFQGIKVVIGHFIALNSVTLFEPFLVRDSPPKELSKSQEPEIGSMNRSHVQQ